MESFGSYLEVNKTTVIVIINALRLQINCIGTKSYISELLLAIIE